MITTMVSIIMSMIINVTMVIMIAIMMDNVTDD